MIALGKASPELLPFAQLLSQQSNWTASRCTEATRFCSDNSHSCLTPNKCHLTAVLKFWRHLHQVLVFCSATGLKCKFWILFHRVQPLLSSRESRTALCWSSTAHLFQAVHFHQRSLNCYHLTQSGPMRKCSRFGWIRPCFVIKTWFNLLNISSRNIINVRAQKATAASLLLPVWVIENRSW